MTDFTPNQALFPDRGTRLPALSGLQVQIDEALADIAQMPVAPPAMSEFRQALSDMTFGAAHTLEEINDWVLPALVAHGVQMTRPGYVGLFNPAPALPAEAADHIMAAINPQLAVWSHAPAAVEIEAHTIAQVAARAGMAPGAGGHFTSGGSEANATALICALTAACPDYAQRGIAAFNGQPRLYASAESHLAWLKIAHQSGMGREAVCLIATDGMGRMREDALQAQILVDQSAGHCPVMIAATAGTTNAGMVDPLHACADLAEAHDLWLHVDAAWGGALIASPREQHVLSGMERASSITIDAHKWFATTVGTGMFLTARPDILTKTFHVTASYMPSADASIDPYLNTAQWSRRFLGLRMFMCLAVAGWDGYGQHVERAIDLIDALNQRLSRAGWTVENASRMAVTCLTPPQGCASAEDIVRRVNADGAFWLSTAKYEGKTIIRVCVTNGRTSRADMDNLADLLIVHAE